MYMPFPDISIPDIPQADIDQFHVNALSVQDFAGRCITATQLPNEQVYYETVQTGIHNVRQYAQAWITQTGPLANDCIYRPVIDFNLTFQLLGNIILNTLEAIKHQDNLPGKEQRRYIDGLLNDLIDTIVQQQQRVVFLRQQVNAFAATLIESVMKPANGVEKITGEIDTEASPIKEDAEIRSYPHSLTGNLLTNTRQVQNSIQVMVTAWGRVKKKFSAIIAHLDGVADEAYAHNLQQLNMAEARLKWQQLAERAAVLMNT